MKMCMPLFLCVAFAALFGALGGNTYSFFSSVSEKQHIVRLVGGCSVGKSSLEGVVSQEEKNWVVIDDDDVCFEYMLKALKKRFPREFFIISEYIEEKNLYHAFLRKQVCFKNEITLGQQREILELLSNIRKELDQPCNIEWIGNVWRSVEVKMINDIRDAVLSGKNILVTASSVSLTQLEEIISPSKVIKVLLYSPLKVSFDRLIQRNKTAEKDKDYSLKRFSTFVPESFCRLMKLTSDEVMACDVDSRRRLEETFDAAIENIESTRPEGTSHTFTQYDFSQEQVRAWEKEFFSSLSTGQDSCFIAPKDAYDIILRSDKSSPEELFQELLEALSHIISA